MAPIVQEAEAGAKSALARLLVAAETNTAHAFTA